jgi:RNA-directed DNA polymerase
MDLKLFKILQSKYESKNLDVFYKELVNDSLVDYILNKKDSFYKNFKIKKKNGSYRSINQPINQLLSIQKEFSLFFLFKRKNHEHSHGFELQKNIITNAQKHVNKKIVLNIDLENFFLNISDTKVIDLLIKEFNVKKEEALKISELLTYNNSLPQGSPSSPVISNLICENLDLYLYEYCKQFNIVYTRYADDMSFSFSFNKLPKIQLDNIISIIEEYGFKINKRKQRYFYRNSRQIVTGLVVNEKVNVKREFYKNLRAILYNWKKYGLNNCQTIFHDKYGIDKDFLLTIRGWINFFGQVKGSNNKQYLFFLEQYKELTAEIDTIKKFNFHTGLSISELKYELNTPVLNLNTLINSDGSQTNFMRHWDAKRRIAVIINKDLINKIKENSLLLLKAEESIKKGDKGKYLMIHLKEFFIEL